VAEKAELAFKTVAGSVSWRMVQQARQWVRQHLRRTPLVECPELCALTGLRVLLKLENLQLTGAFKVRGGLVKLLSVPEAVRRRGVVCASTGNHGKGIAWLARQFGLSAWVVVPEGTPKIKTEAVEALGARLIRFGDTYTQAEAFAKALAAERDLLFAPSFDDPWVIAAQATVAWEILEDAPEVDVIIVPVGGGALLAGSLITARHLKPSLRVCGVEAAGAPALSVSLRAGEPVTLPSVQTRAEGIAVARPGAIPFAIIRQLLVEPVAVVTDEEMTEGVRLLARHAKVVAELAGAASLAALCAGKFDLPTDAVVACVISGGNIDLAVLRDILS
jgi:threonine dehydratase